MLKVEIIFTDEQHLKIQRILKRAFESSIYEETNMGIEYKFTTCPEFNITECYLNNTEIGEVEINFFSG